jgi:kynurenine formamidase
VANNWGRWGDDDERGSLNLLTPAVVQGGIAAVKTGRVYSLGIPIQSSGVPLYGHRGTPMRLTLTNESDEGMYDFMGCPTGTGAHEDILMFASHTTSHIDALSHVYAESVHYNGVKANEMKTHTGAGRLGVEKIGVIAGRGVLLDIAGWRAVEWLEAGYSIGADDLAGCAAAQGVEVRAGDIVLVRTGYLQNWFAATEKPFLQPGLNLEGAQWLADRDVVAIGCDNGAVEVIPFDKDEYLIVHKEILVQRGIYLMEFLNLAELAADRCYEGLITVAPLKVTGATGSPINPVFIG